MLIYSERVKAFSNGCLMMSMITYRLISLILIALLLTACTDNDKQPGSCEEKAVKVKLDDWLVGIRDYRIKAIVEIEGQRLHSTIVGRVPDRLSIRLVPESKEKLVWTTIFDGNYQWVELRSDSNVDVFKIQLKPLIDKQRPFDTSYYIMGSGLMNGEDFPTSIRSLLSTYDLSVSCSQSVITLAGPVNKEKFKSYAKSRRTPQSDKVIERFFKQFGYLVLALDARSHQVTGYRLGVKEGATNEISDKTSQFKVEFTEIRINQGGDPGKFEYVPPAGIVPTDITEQIRLNR